MKRATFALGLALVLAACSPPEERLRAGLIRAGVPAKLAQCMARRMIDRLSFDQLRKLASLPQASEQQSLSSFLYNVRALDDSKIIGVTTSSAALCATGLAR